MKLKIYILLPVHNRRAITEKFIDSLVVQSYTNYHLILIDDGSNDGTDEMVKSKIRNLSILRGKGDWWWAGSLQQGVDWLKTNGVRDEDVVLIMNDDVTFEADFLQTAIQILNTQDGMLLPQVVNQQTGAIEETGICVNFLKFQFAIAESPNKINCLPTRGLFMRMSELDIVGGFHPKMLPHYLSDYEFTIRAQRKGLRLATSPKLILRSNDDATGYRSFEGLSFIEFMKRYFSIKSSYSPIYWTTFVLLASPWRYLGLNLVMVWGHAARAVIRQILRAGSRKGRGQ